MSDRGWSVGNMHVIIKQQQQTRVFTYVKAGFSLCDSTVFWR